jgi:hypothetical protein
MLTARRGAFARCARPADAERRVADINKDLQLPWVRKCKLSNAHVTDTLLRTSIALCRRDGGRRTALILKPFFQRLRCSLGCGTTVFDLIEPLEERVRIKVFSDRKGGVEKRNHKVPDGVQG